MSSPICEVFDVAPSGGIRNPGPAPGAGLWQRLGSTLKALRLQRHAASSDQAWAAALPALQGLDEHLLKDIGAPGWLIQQLRHEQHLPLHQLWELTCR